MKLLILISFLAALPLRAANLNCTADDLNKLFFTPAPELSMIGMWLDRMLYDRGIDPKCLSALNEFKAQLEKGRQARGAYLEMYNRHFGLESDRNLLLIPMQEVVRRIQAAIERAKSKRTLAPPDELAIRNRALQETVTRENLPISANMSDFEKLVKQQPRYDHARLYFQRRMNQLRMTDVQGRAPAPSVEQFKSDLIEKIHGLRVLNLEAAIQEAPELRMKEFTVREDGNSREAKLTFNDLLKMRLRFFDASNLNLPLSTFHGLPEHKRSSWLLRKARDWADPYGTESLYGFHATKPPEENDYVQLVTARNEIFLVSMAEFSRLLDSLVPEQPEDHFGPLPIQRRFRLEAAPRDSLLSYTVRQLRLRDDASLEELQERLRAWIAGHDAVQGGGQPALTYEVNSGGGRVLRDTPASDLIWYGWGQHPQFWRSRIEVANRKRLPIVGAETTKKDRKAIKAAIKQEKKAARWRYASNKRRMDIVRNKALRWSLIFLGGALTFYELPDMATYAVEAGMSLATGDLGLGGQLEDFMDLFHMPGADMVNRFDADPEAQNFNIPRNQRGSGGGGPKTVQSAHDPRSSPFAVEILYQSPSAPTPAYYNFATSTHVPAEALNEGYWKNDQGTILIEPSASTHYDLAIDVNVSNVKVMDRIGLVQISGYRLVNVEIYDWHRTKIRSFDYKVFENPSNRQIYAKIDPAWSGSGPYTFRAFYALAPEKYDTAIFNPGADSSALLMVDHRLEQSGFQDLSSHLDELVKLRSHTGFQDLAQMFHASASYTMDAVSWPARADADAVFKPYTIFLDPKGSLHYQCTGSNRLLQTYLNEAIKLDPGLAGFSTTYLVGYRGEAGGVKRGSVGHLHTALFTTGGNSAFMELDATPDLKDEQGRAVEHPARRPPPVPEISGVLPGRLRVDDEPEELDAEDQMMKKIAEPKNLSASEIERTISQLKELRNEAVSALYPIYEEQAWMKNHHFADLPGIRLLVLSKTLIHALDHDESIATTLARLKNPKAFYIVSAASSENEAQDMKSLFRDEERTLDRSFERVEFDVAQERNLQLEFVLHDPLRSRLRELAAFLSTYDWAEILKVRSCAGVLTQ